jgi:hypothetical protein
MRKWRRTLITEVRNGGQAESEFYAYSVPLVGAEPYFTGMPWLAFCQAVVVSRPRQVSIRVLVSRVDYVVQGFVCPIEMITSCPPGT